MRQVNIKNVNSTDNNIIIIIIIMIIIIIITIMLIKNMIDNFNKKIIVLCNMYKVNIF